LALSASFGSSKKKWVWRKRRTIRSRPGKSGLESHYHFYHLTLRIPRFLARKSTRLQRNAKSDTIPKISLPTRVSRLFGEIPSPTTEPKVAGSSPAGCNELRRFDGLGVRKYEPKWMQARGARHASSLLKHSVRRKGEAQRELPPPSLQRPFSSSCRSGARCIGRFSRLKLIDQ
jgi:hypothetical protein